MTMEELSEEGLERMHDALNTHVDRGAMPGLIALVARSGEAHVDVIGKKAFTDDEPLERDAIFRISSLSKPIGAAAAMMLVDDDTLKLDDPVDGLLPELANRKVLKTLASELDDTVPATRAITVRDLLTFRNGFGCIMAPPNTYPIQTAEAELGLQTLGPPWPPTQHAPDEWMKRLGTLPLMHQPGEEWMYNTGAQVLGVLIERATGKPLERFLRERIFEPLGMKDTSFEVSSAQRGRLTTAYMPDPEAGTVTILDPAEGGYWSKPPIFPNLAAWLLSTIDDYWAFVQMLLAGGSHRGKRLLSKASVELMTTDQLTREQRKASRLFLGPHSGWGFGMAVPARGSPVEGIPGGFGWNGGTGTAWRSDPTRNLTGILFTQSAMTSPEPPTVFKDFWKYVYRAIDG